ncbi:MAG: hypothetical protein IJL66_09530 [Lachnospiraceae bacterium]|nr:hypothetical protein [Lachnospiraceae bacterium]
MRQSVFLKYTSALLMLCSVVRFFFAISMINFFVTAKSLGAHTDEVLKVAVLSLILSFICVLAELIGGFIGAIHWREPMRAGTCLLWGLGALASGLLANLLQHISGYGVSYVAWTTGAVIPGLFVLAALHFFLRKKILSGD